MSWKVLRGMVRRCLQQGWEPSKSWMDQRMSWMKMTNANGKSGCRGSSRRKEHHNGMKVARWAGTSLMERRTMMKVEPERQVPKCIHCCRESES